MAARYQVDLEGIQYYLTTKKFPETLENTYKQTSRFRRLASKFVLVDGKLHTFRNKRGWASAGNNNTNTSSNPNGKKQRVIIDQEERQTILQHYHEGKDLVLEPEERFKHFGQDKTEMRVLRECWWPGIRKDVREYVNACQHCLYNKYDRRNQPVSLQAETDLCGPTGTDFGTPAETDVYVSAETDRTCMPAESDTAETEVCLPAETGTCVQAKPDSSPASPPTRPWERIGVEICHMPKSREGFSFLVVVVDYFSAWMEAEPLTEKKPASVANFLYSLVCRHGCADIQVIDLNKDFTKRVSNQLQRLVGARQRVTDVCHSQANEQYDSYSQVIQDLLVKVLNTPREVDDWPKVLPGILFSCRTKEVPVRQGMSSGLSPFYLFYGRSPKLPVHAENGHFSEPAGGGVCTGTSSDGGCSEGDDNIHLDRTAEDKAGVVTGKGREITIIEDSESTDEWDAMT